MPGAACSTRRAPVYRSNRAVEDLSRAVELDPADLELAGRLEMARRRLRGEDEVASATDARPLGADELR